MSESELQKLLESGEWNNRIQVILNQVVNTCVNNALSDINLDDVVDRHLAKRVKVSKDLFAEQFPGIADNSNTTEITILPNTAVVENKLVTKQLEVIENTKVQDLEVKGALKFNGSALVNDSKNEALLEHITKALLKDLDKSVMDAVATEVKDHITKTILTKGQIEFTQMLNSIVEQELPTILAASKVDEQIKNLIPTILNQTIDRTLKSTDVPALVKENVDRAVVINRTELKKKFPGIEDSSESVQLTLLPGVAVVENDFVSKNIEVVESLTAKLGAFSSLTVTESFDALGSALDGITQKITTSVKSDLEGDWQDDVSKKVTDQIASTGVNIKDALINGKPLIQDGKLTDAVNKIGPQKDLTVNGDATIGPVTIVANRLGINTNLPERSLTVWDEEVSIVAGKQSQNTAYIGTSRGQDLQLGTNNRGHLVIKNDGMVTVTKLKVGKHQIGHSDIVPNWEGTKGDIMFNSNPTDSSSIGWVCLGAYRWKSI